MKTSRTHQILVLSTLILALTPGCSVMSKPLHERTIRMTTAHTANSSVRVQSANGALTVMAGQRDDVEIVAQLRMHNDERLEATRIDASRDSSNRLNIAVIWPTEGRKKNEGCSFTITVPDANGVELKSSNGRIHIAGLSGQANLRTSNGRIRVDSHRGGVIARTSNGRLTVGETDGDLDLATSNGRIEALNAMKSVKARTSNGAIVIHYAEAGTGPVQADTSNGAITLQVGTGFQGELEARTSNGQMIIGDLPNVETISSDKNHMRLKFGDSDDKSQLRTSNGAVEIRRR